MADEPVKENEVVEEVKEVEKVEEVEKVNEKVSDSSEKSDSSKKSDTKKSTEQDRRRPQGQYRSQSQGQYRSQSQSRFRSNQQGGRGPSNYGRGRFQSRRKVCTFCVDNVKSIDWKKVDTWRRLINHNGSIRARRKTGTCAKHQRQLAVAVKRARHIALVPFTDEHVRFQQGR